MVDEEATLRPQGAGGFRLYRLTKRNWGTEEVVLHIARRLGLPRASLAYGGRKDRAAVTAQHVTIRGRRDHSLEGDGFELRSLGFVDRPMAPDAIVANRFAIVLRGLDPACAGEVLRNVTQLTRSGVPNYFDDQRFRSVPQYRGFPAALMVRGEWEPALRLLLTSPEPGTPRRERDRLAHLDEAWGRWDHCLGLARSAHERRVIGQLARPGYAPARALGELPREEVAMLLAAYQSHLWNRALAGAIGQLTAASVALPGLAGDYLFPAGGGEDQPAALRDLVIPTPARRLAATEPAGAGLMLRVLDAEGITTSMLALRPLRTAFLTSTPRAALVKPAAPELVWLAGDEAGRLSIRLTFSLPPGSYATMVVRTLLLRRGSGRTGERPPT